MASDPHLSSHNNNYNYNYNNTTTTTNNNNLFAILVWFVSFVFLFVCLFVCLFRLLAAACHFRSFKFTGLLQSTNQSIEQANNAKRKKERKKEKHTKHKAIKFCHV